jgi:hypothetical protein
MADRGPAPLARTAEVRLSPTVYFEQEQAADEGSAAQLRFDWHDIAVRPSLLATYAFTDSFALVVPGGVLWSPVVQPDQGWWLTVGGGVYGFAFGFGSGSDYLQLTNAAGVWVKRRFGPAFWLTGGAVLFHLYYSQEREPEDGPSGNNFVSLVPALEAGLQVTEAWAVTLLADYGYELLHGSSGYTRLRLEHVFVPVWWIDLGVHGGVYVHPRDQLHVDPLIGLTVTARW